MEQMVELMELVPYGKDSKASQFHLSSDVPEVCVRVPVHIFRNGELFQHHQPRSRD